jgi:hypothetical protein
MHHSAARRRRHGGRNDNELFNTELQVLNLGKVMTERPKNAGSAPRGSGRGKARSDKFELSALINRTIDHFAALTAKEVDGVTGVRRDGEDGWSVLVDVVELERIPSTTTVIATYRVDVDAQGELTGYERLRRYVRGAVDPS